MRPLYKKYISTYKRPDPVTAQTNDSSANNLEAQPTTTKRSRDLFSELIGQQSGADYERGSVETAQAQAENTGEMLGRLVLRLEASGLLTENDIELILNPYYIGGNE